MDMREKIVLYLEKAGNPMKILLWTYFVVENIVEFVILEPHQLLYLGAYVKDPSFIIAIAGQDIYLRVKSTHFR